MMRTFGPLATAFLLTASLALGTEPSNLSSYSTAEEPLDVAVGDLDGDGHQDVVTANREGRSLSVFYGRGDGTLESQTRVNLEWGATSLTLVDADQDGGLEIIATLCSAGCTNNHITVLKRVDQSYEVVAEQRLDGVPYNIAAADIDDDGIIDFAASDYPNNRLIVLLSNGQHGEFAVVHLATGKKPVALQLGDVNGDGVTDLVSSDHGAGQSTVYLSYGGGEFSDPIPVETGKLPYSIALTHLDDDVILDMAVAHSDSPGRVSIMRGRGDGTFGLKDEVELDDRLLFIGAADFDADDVADLLVTRNTTARASVLINEGDGFLEREAIALPISSQSYSVALADLNDDGMPDIVAADFDEDRIIVVLGR